MNKLRMRFWFHSVSAAALGALAVLTTFVPDWIELTGWDPDQHSGTLEWAIVAVLGAAAVASTTAARREWRRRVATT